MASIKDQLEKEVKAIITDQSWDVVDGQVIPDTEDLKLGNHGKRIDATIIYADLAGSTDLVDKYSDTFAAEVYKTYLLCAVRIIRNNGGTIASFDGDRVMGIFHGDSKNTNAAKSALQINWAVINIINPRLEIQYPKKDYRMVAACGVDTSKILVARTGIRNNNDLVWVGRAANYAAKLCGLRQENYASWITGNVYDNLNETLKSTDGKKVWEARTWTAKGGIPIYRSNWTWQP